MSLTPQPSVWMNVVYIKTYHYEAWYERLESSGMVLGFYKDAAAVVISIQIFRLSRGVGGIRKFQVVARFKLATLESPV